MTHRAIHVRRRHRALGVLSSFPAALWAGRGRQCRRSDSSRRANQFNKKEIARRLRLFYLPGYSPELNPDELLNQDVKSNADGRRRSRNKRELLGNVRGYLRSTQRQPRVVRNYFQEKHVRYAA